MKILTIKRPKERFNMLSEFYVKIGRRPIAKLKNGERLTIELSHEQEE